MKAALTRPNNKTGLCITHCKRFRLYWWIGKAIFIICALRKQKKVGEIIAIKMEIKGMNTANRLCYHSRADSREVTVAHLRFDSSCIRWDFQRGVPLFGEVENRIVAAECEFNSTFTICTTCFWISWQKSHFPKEKKNRNSDHAGKMSQSGVLSVNLSPFYSHPNQTPQRNIQKPSESPIFYQS